MFGLKKFKRGYYETMDSLMDLLSVQSFSFLSLKRDVEMLKIKIEKLENKKTKNKKVKKGK